jgi:hypothetical protein
MGSFLLPIIVVLVYMGLQAGTSQSNAAMSGQGPGGRATSLSKIQALQAQLFATACQNVAAGSPGLINASIGVPLPVGVPTPTGAICMTTAAAPSGRNIFAYMPAVPGEAGEIRSASFQSVAWFRVAATGQAINLVTAQGMAIPASIPTGTVLAWIKTAS